MTAFTFTFTLWSSTSKGSHQKALHHVTSIQHQKYGPLSTALLTSTRGTKKLFKNTCKQHENVELFNKRQLFISYEAFNTTTVNQVKTKIIVLTPAALSTVNDYLHLKTSKLFFNVDFEGKKKGKHVT